MVRSHTPHALCVMQHLKSTEVSLTVNKWYKITAPHTGVLPTLLLAALVATHYVFPVFIAHGKPREISWAARRRIGPRLWLSDVVWLSRAQNMHSTHALPHPARLLVAVFQLNVHILEREHRQIATSARAKMTDFLSPGATCVKRKDRDRGGRRE